MTRPPNTRRARARRQEQRAGAIFVEALIVIGLIVVCMQCIWGMYRYCMFQHRAQLDARQVAWENALKGCGGADVSGPLNGLSKSAGDPSEVGGLQADSEEAPSWFGIGQAEEASVSLDLPAEIFGTSVVASKESFACNEKGKHEELELGGGGPDTNGTMKEATNVE